MNYAELKEKYDDLDLDAVTNFLEDFRDALETEEPHATSSINDLSSVLVDLLPGSLEDLEAG